MGYHLLWLNTKVSEKPLPEGTVEVIHTSGLWLKKQWLCSWGWQIPYVRLDVMLKSIKAPENQIWYPPISVYDSGENQFMRIYQTLKNVLWGLKLHEKVNYEGGKKTSRAENLKHMRCKSGLSKARITKKTKLKELRKGSLKPQKVRSANKHPQIDGFKHNLTLVI